MKSLNFTLWLLAVSNYEAIVDKEKIKISIGQFLGQAHWVIVTKKRLRQFQNPIIIGA